MGFLWTFFRPEVPGSGSQGSLVRMDGGNGGEVSKGDHPPPPPLGWELPGRSCSGFNIHSSGHEDNFSLQNLDDERVFPWTMGGVGHREV